MLMHVAGVENASKVNIDNESENYNRFSVMKILPANRITFGNLSYGFYNKTGKFTISNFEQDDIKSFYYSFVKKIIPDLNLNFKSISDKNYCSSFQEFLLLLSRHYIYQEFNLNISVGHELNKKILNDFLIYDSVAQEQLESKNYLLYSKFLKVFECGSNNGIVTFYRFYDYNGYGI